MALGIALAATVAAGAATPDSNPGVEVVAGTETVPTLDRPAFLADFVLVKSVFVDDPRLGKDPFFPESQRRSARRVTTPTQPVVPVTELTVKGISGRPGHRLAIINNRTFAIGETAEMKVDKHIVKVQCLEITDTVVKVTIDGVPKDLPIGTQ